MRKSLIACGALLTLAGLAVSAQAQVPVVDYKIYRSASTLMMDGKITEVLWQKAPVVTMAGTKGEPTAQKTTVQLLWDDTYFYVGIQAQDSDAWTTFTENETNLWENEVLEVYLDPTGIGNSYYEFEISPAGNVIDLFVTNGGQRLDGKFISMREWNCAGLRSKAFVNGDAKPGTQDVSWSAEMMIPFDSLWTAGKAHPEPGDTWRVNMYRWERNTANPKEQVLSCMSSTDGREPHTPWRFATVTFMK